MTTQSTKLPFDSFHPDWAIVRQVIFNRLRADPTWQQHDYGGDGFDPYVDYKDNVRRPREFAHCALEVFWQLFLEGILAPGIDVHNPNLPWFHITRYGRHVLDEGEFQPYDPTSYLARLRQRVQHPDPTVMVYIAEALETFRKRSFVASMVMLGVAAERVFLLLCTSMLASLAAERERSKLQVAMSRVSMKAKLALLHPKIVQLQSKGLTDFPENAALAVTVVYDLIRNQRNDLGHPRDTPPLVTVDDAFTNLQIFPPYYAATERLRVFLSLNKT